mmetsp:Transcript_123847/g.361634  ORF Transcript_123847/g.361634 Transcript_123847/m.361634 type:complete len:981 (-) Transcript_123847:117-3059(-)
MRDSVGRHNRAPQRAAALRPPSYSTDVKAAPSFMLMLRAPVTIAGHDARLCRGHVPSTARTPENGTVPAPLWRSLGGALAIAVVRWPLRRRRTRSHHFCRVGGSTFRCARAELRLMATQTADAAVQSASAADAVGEVSPEEELPPKPHSKRAASKPWLAQHLPAVRGQQTDSHDLLLRFLAALDTRGVELYPAQEEAILELFRGAHVVLDTPTGSGKSLVAVAACFQALGRGQRAYYTSPTKALVSEKFFDLCRYFGTESVGLATGDASVNTYAPLVCCTAEVLTSIALHDGAAASVDCVIMDEFHYYGDPARGASWEIPLWRLPHVAFLLMSGTLGANPGLYNAIETHSGRPLSVVSSRKRPVPLDFNYYKDLSVRSTLEMLLREGKFPVYVVHFSQRGALSTARAFADEPLITMTAKQRSELEEIVAATDFNSPFGHELRQLLQQGIGLHHAGLLPRYRRVVEQLAQASLLMIICGTDTLGVGVNVPIRSVLLTRLCKFNGQETALLQSREFLQIAGRAGRKGFDDRGEVVAVSPEWEVFNKELAKRVQQGIERHPRWKRPPQRNYRHWKRATFTMLQTKPPAPLKSQFQLSMSQVLSVLHGASVYGRNGRDELRQLVDAAQCSWRQQRFLHRQVDAFVKVLNSSGSTPKEVNDHASVSSAIPSTSSNAVGKGGASAADGSCQEQASTTTDRSREGYFSFLDDTSLFLLEALPVLEKQIEAEDFHLAVVAAVEAVCDAPTAILRAKSGPRKGGTQLDQAIGICPEPLENLLFRSFAIFRSRHPWVPEGALQPKGFALELVEGRLSFSGLVSRLTSHGFDDSVVIAEGGLLRYLADVYRTLRQCVPPAFKTEGILDAERHLRAAVASVDSSLLQEWEALNARERGLASAPAAEADAEDAVGGAMVPRAGPSSQQRRPRTQGELEQRVLEVVAGRAERQRQLEEAERRRLRHPLARARRWSSEIWGRLERGVQTVLDVIW